MSIAYSEEKRIFKLDAKDTTMIIEVFDDDGFVTMDYYGKYIPDTEMSYLLGPIAGACPSKVKGHRNMFMGIFPFVYPTFGVGDFRDHCLEVETMGGHHACDLHYVSHEIVKGKPAIPGLPAAFDRGDVCETLILHCKDMALDLAIELVFTAFENLDVITRSVRVTNEAAAPIYLKRVLSACIDMEGQDYDILTLHGDWAQECQLNRTAVNRNRVISESSRGETSAQANAFMALCSKGTNEEYGEVYAMNFVYSGNFYASAEGNHGGNTRMVMGINPLNFTWKLEKGETFYAPEVVMVYSQEGLGGMSRTFHDLYRGHLIRSPYRDKERPILVNNWEATYFDFDTDKLLALTKEASECGIEMLVLDDGWFGTRSSDNRGLGDWVVNEEKLKGGLKYLTDHVNDMGMKFGLWIEPEMVNPDSDLFRAHPDWAIQIPGRPSSLSRNQLVLDWSRKEVRDGVYGQIKKVLDSANVAYIKWDMNRHLTELGSFGLSGDRQQELSHRYVLGVYDIMDRLITDFPELLYENCSSGGARFDPGVLYYSPQVWTSDDTDAILRIRIQGGTSLLYPLSSMGAHVSAVPNHQTGRITPFETRGIIALFGTFGYELDVTKLSDEEKALIRKQTERYHKYNHLVRGGDFYRLTDLFDIRDNAAFGVVSKDKSEALIAYIQIHAKPGFIPVGRRVRLRGLDPDAYYVIKEHIGGNTPADDVDSSNQEALQASGFGAGSIGKGFRASGAALMNGGFWFEKVPGDYQAQLLYLVKEA